MRWRRCSASMTIGHGGHSCASTSYCRDLQFSGSSGRAGRAGRAPGGLHFGHRRPMPLTRCHYAHYTGLSGQKGGYSYGCRSRVESFLFFSSLEYRDLVHIHPSTETEIERIFIYVVLNLFKYHYDIGVTSLTKTCVMSFFARLF